MFTKKSDEADDIIIKAIAVISSSRTEEQQETAFRFSTLALESIKNKTTKERYLVYTGILQGIKLQMSVEQRNYHLLLTQIAEELGY